MNLLKPWLCLIGLQLVTSLVVFSDFLSGKYHFAYLDIGSDSFTQFVPYAMYIARTLPLEGITGWSFLIGLGGPTLALTGDFFSLLWQWIDPDHVAEFRIYIYLLKIVIGGSFCYFLIREYSVPSIVAVTIAFAYSFCGFVVINGQWDPEATSFLTYPLVLWAIVRRLQHGGIFLLPLGIAFALFCGTFFVSLAVFLLFTCFFFIICSESPGAMVKKWMYGVLPLFSLGYLIAAPYLLPVAVQLLDSSRVSGSQSLIQTILSRSFSISDWPLIATQVGGLFHKDLYGVGSAYRGYANYLEGPGFYFGLTLFILIPQLWGRSKIDNRLLIISLFVFLAYIFFPAIRFAAMGFGAPYFRVSTLWVSAIGLLLGTKALEHVISVGFDSRLLLVSICMFLGALLIATSGTLSESIWLPHLYLTLAILAFSSAVMTFTIKGWVAAPRLPFVLLFIIVLECILISRPSFTHDRAMVDSRFAGYSDRSLSALNSIKQFDTDFFRVEKDFHSVSLADAMAQNYMGIKSYSLHGRGMVDFHIGAGLLPVSSTVINYSNWLSNAGDRFVLNSFLGVKYFLAQSPINWPGFTELPTDSGLHVYRNEFVLPLGFVQTSQVERSKLSSLMKSHPANANNLVDVSLFNAAIVDQPIEGYGQVLDIEGLSKLPSFSLQDLYFSKAKELQDSGLQIEKFASNHVIGQIRPSSAGILVFTIPFSSGWRLLVDGVETPIFRVDYGLLGATVSGGSHRIELVFRIPGLDVGIALGSLGMLILLVLTYWSRRARVLGSKL